MQRLNVKLLACLIIGVVVLVASVHVIHGFQIGRNASTLLEAAQKAEKEGDKREALKKYSDYLKHRPDEKELWGKRAQLAVEIAEEKDATRDDVRFAYLALDVAVKETGSPEIRRQLIDYLMKFGLHVDALTNIELMRDEAKADGKRLPDMDYLFAVCKVRSGHDAVAINTLSELIGYDPENKTFDTEKATALDKLDAYLMLADLYEHRMNETAQAEAVLQQMVKVNPESGKAYIRLGQFLQRRGKMDEAKESVEKARQIAPDMPEAILAVANVAMAMKDMDYARSLLEEGVKKHPDNEGMYSGLALMAINEQDVDEALKQIELGIEAIPKSETLLVLLADVQLQKQDQEGLRKSIEKMRSSSFRSELIGYFEARELILAKKWLQGSRQLEKLRPLMSAWPDLVRQVDLMLGLCYENLGQPDKQLEAVRRVLEAEPNLLAAKLAEMRALAAVGKRGDATKKLEQVNQALGDGPNMIPQLRKGMLEVKISEQLQKPSKERDWKEVDMLVEQVSKNNKLTDLQKELLNVDILMVKDDLPQAKAKLLKLQKQGAKEPAFWWSMITYKQKQAAVDLEKRSDVDEAGRQKAVQTNAKNLIALLNKAEEACGQVPTFRSLRIAATSYLPKEDANAGLLKFEAAADKMESDSQLGVWVDLANAFYRLRDYEQMKRLWGKITQAKPDDLKLWLIVFDLAIDFDDEQGIEESMKQIGKLADKSSATYKYCEVSRKILDVRKKTSPKSSLEDARKIVKEAQRLRPEWHELYRLEGEINELEEHRDAAITSYQNALERGPANPLMARRLVVLLYRQQRMDEIPAAMKYVGQHTAGDVVGRIDIEQKLLSGNNDEAIEEAGKSVAEDPENATNHLWYAQLLSRANQPEKAEAEFRIATEKDPKSGQAWLSLINHLVNVKKKGEVGEVIRAAKEALPEDQVTAVMAQAYDLLGDGKKAETLYLAAMEEYPDNPTLLRSFAIFHMRRKQLEKALPLVEKLRSITPDAGKASDVSAVNWSRRAMAEILSRRGTYTDIQKAVKLIEEGAPNGQVSQDDLLIIASILAGRPEPSSRTRAIDLLEQIQTRSGLNPPVQLTLAGLYERAGNWPKAREQMVGLGDFMDKNPRYLGDFILMLLRNKDLDDVNPWLNKLIKLDPRHPRTLELKARYLAAQGKPEAAAKLVLSAVPEELTDDNAPSLAAAARLLESFKMYDDAEKLYRQYYEHDPKEGLRLAIFLGRQGKTEEAYELLEQARRSQPTDAVIQSALEILRTQASDVRPEDFARVDGWLQQAISDSPNDVNLKQLLAVLRDMQGRGDEMIDVYRELIARPDVDPNVAAVIKNNWAFCLAQRGTGKDIPTAEKAISEAIEVLGPVADVLDTRGVILMAKGDTKGALADLKVAATDQPSAVKYFHLAIAEEKANDRAAASESLKKAFEMELQPRELSAVDRAALAKLKTKLNIQ